VMRRPLRAPVIEKIPLKPQILRPEEVRLRYDGTSISPGKELLRGETPLRKEISAKLSQLDFIPNVRRVHFRWLENHPVKVTGWLGEIENLEEIPEGILVRVNVWPNVVPFDGKYLVHQDHFYETYLYSKGALNLVSWLDPGPASFFVRP